jgi:hypothetical protein
MNEKYEQLIADYLEGTLDDASSKELEQLIEKGEIDFIDFKAFEQLHNDLEMISIPKPSDEMRNRFYSMLNTEQEKLKSSESIRWIENLRAWINSLTAPKLAYAFILLVIGGFIGNLTGSDSEQIEQLTSEMESMRQIMMVSMLEGPSATDRLRAVNISSQLPQADERAVQALLFTLNNDSSENVRIQTIQALTRWGDIPTVREGMIRSISRQESDLVIVALADAMVELGARNAAQEFEKLKQERELSSSIRSKIDNTIAVLL